MAVNDEQTPIRWRRRPCAGFEHIFQPFDSKLASLLTLPESEFEKCQEAGMPFISRKKETVVLGAIPETTPGSSPEERTLRRSLEGGCARSPIGTITNDPLSSTQTKHSRFMMKPVSSMLNTFVDATLYSRMISPRQSKPWAYYLLCCLDLSWQRDQ